MRDYSPRLTATINKKGVLDIDTVKGCTLGMQKYPYGGCYGLCYAFNIADSMNFNFRKSVSRHINGFDREHIEDVVKRHSLSWFRIGTMGDPSHDWDLTIEVCSWLSKYKIPIIITKHWIQATDNQLIQLALCGAIVNTSISPLDTIDEILYRLEQFKRLKSFGVKSILRIVSIKPGYTDLGIKLKKYQDKLFKYEPFIDNPLRIPVDDKRVKEGHILVSKEKDVTGYRYISVDNKQSYIGNCQGCPDQCGINL
jgi:hypothetical protein